MQKWKFEFGLYISQYFQRGYFTSVLIERNQNIKKFWGALKILSLYVKCNKQDKCVSGFAKNVIVCYVWDIKLNIT